ncbi:PAS domain-containing protein [Microvirga calopogonii]|uniref:PAS domain-containing protein n=1 Tax=Microvirga calopogonii TaxID=2078013 RepID=UPI000E0DC595|nr:PAS domain-containing protein [Microvirga calopogonii]
MIDDPKPDVGAWLRGDGKMARRIRELNWAATPLGPIEQWPQSLKTAVQMMLASGHAMMLAWGPARTILYNDAYAPMLGNRHPGALGLPFHEAWPDIWEEITPLVAQVFAGETVRYEDLPLVMTRYGYPEDTWWNFSYSPVGDEAGAVAGLLNVTVDATPRKRAERAEAALRESEQRQAFLLKLSDALRPLADAAEIQATTTRLVGQHLGVDRAMYAEVEGEPGAETGIIRGQYVRPACEGCPSVVPFPERFTFQPFGAHTMPGRYRGELLVVADVNTDPGFDTAERAAWTAAGVRAAVVAPLAKGGRLVAEFGVHCTAPRAWTDAEVSLVQDVAERTWAAAERARAEAALRATSERLAGLVQGLPVAIGLTDAQGEVTLANEAWRAMIPKVIPTRDPKRLPLWRAWGPDGRPLDKSEFPGARALRGETVLPGIEMLYGGEREAHWKQVSSIPLRDEHGDVIGTVSAIADIDALKRSEAGLRESEEQYRILFESIDEGFCVIEVLFDTSGEPVDYRFLQANPVFERQTGLVDAMGRRIQNWLRSTRSIGSRSTAGLR